MSAGLAVLFGVLVPVAGGQQAGRVYQLGFLSVSSRLSSSEHGLFEGLRELGYVEGQNLAMAYRWANNDPARLPELAAELIRARVDVIVANSTVAAQAAKATTGAVPIVVLLSADPVRVGLVSSLARPGGNVTGMSTMAPEIDAKRLALFKEAVPRIAHVAVLANPTAPFHAQEWGEIERAAPSLRVRAQRFEAKDPSEFDGAFAAMARARADALLVLNDPIFGANSRQLVELARQYRLPTMFHTPSFVEAGGLMAYGPNSRAICHRAATLVDKILKGAKPADLPIEQPTKFELVVNLRTARALGLSVPQSVVVRAHRVIQ